MPKKWLEERYLLPWDFFPYYSVYSDFVGRPRRLKKNGLEPNPYYQKGKMRQGSDILDAYNFFLLAGTAVAAVYMAYNI